MKPRKCMLPGLAKYKKSPFKQKKIKDTGFIRNMSPESKKEFFKKLKDYNEGFQFGPDGHWHTGPGEISIT